MHCENRTSWAWDGTTFLFPLEDGALGEQVLAVAVSRCEMRVALLLLLLLLVPEPVAVGVGVGEIRQAVRAHALCEGEILLVLR